MLTVLQVRHKDKPKMVGKVLTIPPNKLICCHEATKTQYHRQTNSPGGIDLVAIQWLVLNDVVEFHHFDKERKTLYIAPVKTILDQAIRQESDHRIRLYLPEPMWRQRSCSELPYKTPWTNNVVVLNPDDNQEERPHDLPEKKAAKRAGYQQESLF